MDLTADPASVPNAGSLTDLAATGLQTADDIASAYFYGRAATKATDAAAKALPWIVGGVVAVAVLWFLAKTAK